MTGLSRRTVLRAGSAAPVVVLPGCSTFGGPEPTDDINVFNQTATTVTANLTLTQPPGEAVVLDDVVTLAADDYEEYANPVSEGEERTYRLDVRLENGREARYEWSENDPPRESDADMLDVSIRESEIAFSHSTY